VLITASADNVDPRNVSVTVNVALENKAHTGVLIQWKDPPSPNGLIVLYEIELSKADVANVSTCFSNFCCCTFSWSVNEIINENINIQIA